MARPRVYGRIGAAPRRQARAGRSVKTWNLGEVEGSADVVALRVLATEDGARAIAIRLGAGWTPDDHQVRERAWVVVVEGSVEIHGRARRRGRRGTLVTFDSGERHAVSSTNGARLLLLLAPWPADGHYHAGETRR